MTAVNNRWMERLSNIQNGFGNQILPIPLATLINNYSDQLEMFWDELMFGFPILKLEGRNVRVEGTRCLTTSEKTHFFAVLTRFGCNLDAQHLSTSLSLEITTEDMGDPITEIGDTQVGRIHRKIIIETKTWAAHHWHNATKEMVAAFGSGSLIGNSCFLVYDWHSRQDWAMVVTQVSLIEDEIVDKYEAERRRRNLLEALGRKA